MRGKETTHIESSITESEFPATRCQHRDSGDRLKPYTAHLRSEASYNIFSVKTAMNPVLLSHCTGSSHLPSSTFTVTNFSLGSVRADLLQRPLSSGPQAYFVETHGLTDSVPVFPITGTGNGMWKL